MSVSIDYDKSKACWKSEEEQILREWADKAQCYRWLHAKSHEKYRFKHALFTIPVIIISTITGTANFAQERVPVDYTNAFVMSVGGLNILAGIISTVAQFLKIAELNESHRVASIAWGKFNRRIKVELARHPDDRPPVFDFMKASKEEYDRLLETSPSVSNDIIKLFKIEFKGSKDLILPEICGEMQTTSIFQVFKSNIPEIPDILGDKLEEIKTELHELKKPIDDEEELDKKIVEIVRNDFRKKHGRNPTEAEFIKEYDKLIKENKV